jgi:superfamily II DNA or RNA helicase
MSINLRPYQIEAEEKTWDALQKLKSVGCVMPTGSGKSIVETRLIDRMVEQLEFSECVLVLSHITDVTYQIMDNYKKFGKHPKAVGLLHANSNPGFSSKIVFSTMQSGSRGERMQIWQNKSITRNPKYILIDEAHLMGTRSYEIICKQYFPKAKVVGFSATPFRENKYSFSQFEAVPYSIDIQTLVDQGYLCPPQLIEIKFDDKTDSERLHNVVEIIKQKELKRRLVSVVYLPDTHMAKEWHNVLSMHCRSIYIDGKTARDRAVKIYEGAREGNLDVIVNCKKLETGIDIPNIGAIFMPYPLKSVVSYLQRIGRALRLYPNKAAANIYVFGNSPSISRGYWKKLHQYTVDCKQDPEGPGAKLKEELEWLLLADNRDESKIQWTQSQIEAVEKLTERKMFDVARLLEYKKFPKKFAKAITQIMSCANPVVEKDSKISEAQLYVLRGYGFKDDDIKDFSKTGAQGLITGIGKYMARDPWVLPYGPHQGKHIGETPSLYRARIKDPVIKRLFYKWKQAGRPAPC